MFGRSHPAKSVSFEEYRAKSWHDICHILEREAGGTRMDNLYGKNHHGVNRSGYCQASGEAAARLPSPLEPKQCLIRCRDPVAAELTVIPNWWRSKILGNPGAATPDTRRFFNPGEPLNANYVMPSSLIPSPQCGAKPSVLPPPTAFRDSSEPRPQFLEDNDSQFEMIEIKRPVTHAVHRESETGLAAEIPFPFEGSEKSIKPSGNKCDIEGSCPDHPRWRSGLFELPEVYSPPPLRPPTPRQKLTLPSPRSQGLEGMMPSFAENSKGISSATLVSPRLAYSEPILKSTTPRDEVIQRRTEEVTTTTTPQPQGERRNQRSQAEQSYSHESPFRRSRRSDGATYRKGDSYDPGRRHPLHQEHQSSSHLHDSRGSKRVIGHGREHDAGKVSNHNCLSPRARMSSHLQPTVITPAMAESLLNDCQEGLRSMNWEDNYEAFSQLHDLTEIHPSRVKPVLNKVIWLGLPHLSSPRTKLARMACICFKRLFQTQKRCMEVEGEKVFYRMMDLCGSMSNSFIQQECKEALIAAVESIDPLKSITFLELHGSKHKNPHVREFAAYLLNAIMDELPTSRLMNKELAPRIIPMIAGFLKEGLLQTRLNAKLALDKIFDHSSFNSKLRRYVSPENLRHISETLREFRERRNGH